MTSKVQRYCLLSLYHECLDSFCNVAAYGAIFFSTMLPYHKEAVAAYSLFANTSIQVVNSAFVSQLWPESMYMYTYATAVAN